jgi:hypothetical protein
MPARSTNKAQTTRHTAPPSTQPIAISPTLVALVQFACNHAPIANGFLVAWQQMPAMVAQLADGEGDSCEGTTRYSDSYDDRRGRHPEPHRDRRP